MDKIKLKLTPRAQLNVNPSIPKILKGEDGFSPIATVEKEGKVATITITDKNGTTTAEIYDGEGGGGGGGTTDYTDLTNKPKINNVTLSGSKSAADFGLATPSDIPDVSGFYTKPSSGIPVSDLASGVIPDVSGFYEKPSGGIPKTDLAEGVQTSLEKADSALQSFTETDPTVPAWAKAANKPSYTASEVGALPADTAIPSKTSDLTNDSGFLTSETDPTVPSWAKSPNKPTYTASEVGALPDDTTIPSKTSDLTNDSGYVGIKDSTKTNVDLDISDENGNVILRLKDGHIQTKEFDSSELSADVKDSTKTGVDLDVADGQGNVILRLKDGNIQTKYFNSADRQAADACSFPFAKDKFYAHMFIGQVDASFSSTIVIPSESIFDVQIASRLGFKYFEANVRKTSDGKYVVTHGLNGYLGNDFETLQGASAADVNISETTFADLRNNYRYRSSYEKYKVPITSLEEFCEACLAANMRPVLQYVDEDELEIAKGYFGNDMILYNGDRTVFGGYIMEFLKLATKELIVDRCQTVGAPYMYCMSNYAEFTDSELYEIIAAVHSVGCYIGFAGNYTKMDTIIKLLRMGFDFSSSDCNVNDFDGANIMSVYADHTFSGVTHTGTVSNGVLTLADGDTITVSSGSTTMLQKAMIDIIYDGTLYLINKNVTSDGKAPVHFGYCTKNGSMALTFTASGTVTVKDFACRISSC